MRPLAVASLLLAAAAAGAGADAPGRPGLPDPCVAAKGRLPARAAGIVGAARADVETYRAAWREACDPANGPADLARLISDAEALVADVRSGPAVAALARTLGPADPWPVPGVLGRGDAVEVDWAAFAAFAPRGSAEDQRYFHGLARATGADGGPAWLGEPAPDGAPCVRLGDVSWAEVAGGIEEMERSSGDAYARRTASLHERLTATLERVGRGGVACGCVRGDPLPALEALAGAEAPGPSPGGGVAAAPARRGTPARRALIAAARGAADALRAGRARVTWLREAPDAPATGCGPAPR